MSFFERLRPQLPSLLVEAVSVLLAVLLALAIDEWRESRTNDRLRDEMLQKLALEVGKNRENLDLAMTLQRDELTGIQELRSRIDEGEPLSEARLNVSTELLRDAAWQTALVTGAVQFMDLDQVSELTDAYTVQSMVDDGFRRIVQVLASGELQSKGGHGMALAELDGSLRQLLLLEENLAQMYASYLEAHAADGT